MEINVIDTSTVEALNQAHQKRIGSSAICTVAGLNPFQTPLQLWLEKTGRVQREPENNAMWLGTKLEPIVAEMFGRTWEGSLVKNTLSAIPKDKDWMVATPDYLMSTEKTGGDEMILEIKTTSAWAKDKWEEGIPDYAHCQVQWQMGIWGIKQAKVACLVGGRDLIVKDVTFAPDVFSQLIELGGKFMEFIKTDTAPIARAEDLGVLKEMLQPTAGKVAECSVEIERLALEFLRHKKEKTRYEELIKPHEVTLKAIQAHLTQLMGDAELSLNPLIKIERKRSLRKGYSVKESWVERFTVKSLAEVNNETSNDGN